MNFILKHIMYQLCMAVFVTSLELNVEVKVCYVSRLDFGFEMIHIPLNLCIVLKFSRVQNNGVRNEWIIGWENSKEICEPIDKIFVIISIRKIYISWKVCLIKDYHEPFVKWHSGVDQRRGANDKNIISDSLM